MLREFPVTINMRVESYRCSATIQEQVNELPPNIDLQHTMLLRVCSLPDIAVLAIGNWELTLIKRCV